MVSTRFNLSLLVATCLLQLARAQSTSPPELQVQVDLVFPKNNTKYIPTYPFPIVFAVRNFAAAWSFKPVLNWRLIDTFGNSRTTANEGSIGWHEGWASPPEAPFMYINASKSVAGYKRSTYELEYSFRVGSDGCRGSLSGLDDANLPGALGSIFFSTDIDRGILPDVTANGSCATPLGAVSIIGKNPSDPSCPPLKKPNSAPSSCAFEINQDVAHQVFKEMTQASDCKTGTWPRGTGIGEKCPNDPIVTSASKSAGITCCPTTRSRAYSAIVLILLHAFL